MRSSGAGCWARILCIRELPLRTPLARRRPPAKGPPPIPVVAATSHKGDIGVYYSGLGAVTPLATVTVKSRVDGQLMSVRYREGDTVRKGDLLVEIDDGPYQAALIQAEGQLMKDQAALENARIDLVRYQQLVPQKAIPEQQLATQQATVHQDEGVVKLDEGQIESAKVNLAYCKIAAPATWTHWVAAGRPRKYRSGRRHQRIGGHHADGSHQRHLYDLRRSASGGAQEDGRRARRSKWMPTAATPRRSWRKGR
jgi:multidrug efflux pump subunit AcrA (membrane-fusion protein)